MTIEQFNHLPFGKRGQLLYTGDYKHLTERVVYGKYIVQLHQMKDFYVEVYYNVTTNEIEDVKAISDEEAAELYVEDLANLIKG